MVPVFGSETKLGAEMAATKTHAIWCTQIRKFFRYPANGGPVLMSEERAMANASAWNAWGGEVYKVVPWDETAKAIHSGAKQL